MKKALPVLFMVILMSLSGVAAAQPSDSCAAEPEVMTTSDGVEFVRTPDACFENLPDWPYEPQYVEIDGLRQAYVDVGTGESGETILLLHGQPSWSYLYRHMIPVLADAGHRVIAMDHLGFGRSDKPIDPDYYTYVDHVERLETFIEELELEGITPFVQDWGSLIGLQVVGTNPDWFDRLVVGNGFLPTYAEGETLFELPENPEMTRNLFHQTMTNTPAQQEPLVRDESGFGTFELNDFDLEALDLAALDLDVFDADANYFGIWIDYSRNDERFRPEVIVEAQTYFDLTPEEEAAYAAPFPSREYMGGARAFPGLVNQLGGVTDSGWAGLGEFDKPFLTIWGDNDGGNLGQPFVQGALLLHIPGSEGWDHVRLEEASHFLQDDQGEEIARRMNEFIAQSSEQVANPQQALPDSEEARRNCELHVITMEEGQLVFNVWHTLNLNNCPPDAWAAIDTDAIQEEMGALAVMKDGPRYALAESASFEGLTDEVVTRTFGTLEMQLFAQIELSMEDMAAQGGSADGGQTSYAPSAIQRTTALTYDAGDTVYVIVDAEGTQYIMISYSQEIDPTLSRDDLLTLNDRLTLPDGWRYEVITLENSLEVVADGLTTVLSDEFGNVYQVVNEPIAANDEASIGYEIVRIVSPNEAIVWANVDGITQEEFDAIDLPTGWLKNQPREVMMDDGTFSGSPGAASGDFVDEEHFGHTWRHVATIVEVNVPLDDDELLTVNTIAKSHAVTFEAGRTLSILISPEDEHFVLITRDAGRTTDVPTIPDGWRLAEHTLEETLVVQLPDPTLNIRADNEDSFQGPIPGLSELVDAELATASSTQDDVCFIEPEVMTTADGVEFVRTPDACFENLPDWPYESQYVEIDGLRQAYVDVGTGESGETILLLHGQPSWSYLYRHMIPVLAEEGHRVIAMDHLGMGRSDKPIDWEYYTYVDHVERLEAFIQELELEQGNLTVFVQDWGSLIGLQVVGTNPDWFDRVVVGNGVLPVFEEGTVPSPLPPNPELTRNLWHTLVTSVPAQQPEFYDEEGNMILSLIEAADLGSAIESMMQQAGQEAGDDLADAGIESGFGIWIDYARNDERFRPEQIVEQLTYFDLTDEEETAYAAPFPTRITMGGVRAFPGLVNQMPGLTQVGWDGLGEFEKPFLTIWASNDPGGQGSPAVQAAWLEHVPGTEGWDHVRLPEASHFLQDDQGEEIARRMNEFIELAPVD